MPHASTPVYSKAGRSSPLIRGLVLASTVAALAACASAPTTKSGTSNGERPLPLVVNKRHHQVALFIDSERLQGTPRVGMPIVQLAGDAHGKVTPAQAALVANHAGRSVCLGLAPYVEFEEVPTEGAFVLNVEVTAIKSSSGAASGASWLIGNFIPVPLPVRIPAGLGGLAIEASLQDAQAVEVARFHWARGANPARQDAVVSAIGDAWSLAGDFGTDFTRALLDRDAAKKGMQREPLPTATVQANRDLCGKTFGKIDLARRGASMLLPVLLDPGPPVAK